MCITYCDLRNPRHLCAPPYPPLSLPLPPIHSMAAGTAFKPFSMAEGLLPSLPTAFSSKPSLSHFQFFRFSKPLPRFPCFRSSSSVSLRKKLPLLPLVAQTSDWARQEEEEEENEVGEGGFGLEGLGEGDGPGIEESGEQEELEEDGGVVAQGEGQEEEEEAAYAEPPEEAKLFVGNLPYDMDSEKLALLFEKAGVVEVAEVEHSPFFILLLSLSSQVTKVVFSFPALPLISSVALFLLKKTIPVGI